MGKFAANARGDLSRGFVIGIGGGGVGVAGVGAGVGKGVGDGAGAGAGGTGAGAGAVTLGTGIGTKMSFGGAMGGFPTAVAGGINGASELCHVTSRENTILPVSAFSSLWQSCPWL